MPADDQFPPPADLYEADFYLWTQAQADALARAGAAGNLDPAIDWRRLAEEVGDLGRSNFNACQSYVTRILQHFYLLAATQREEPKNHWRAEIVAFRGDLALELSPSLRRKTAAVLPSLHTQAAKVAAAKLAAIEPDAPPPDAARRWTLAQILGEADDPIG